MQLESSKIPTETTTTRLVPLGAVQILKSFPRCDVELVKQSKGSQV